MPTFVGIHASNCEEGADSGFPRPCSTVLEGRTSLWEDLILQRLYDQFLTLLILSQMSVALNPIHYELHIQHRK